MKRNCGFVIFHFSVFVAPRYAPPLLDWNGAYFQMRGGRGEGGFFGVKNDDAYRQWHSAIREMDAEADIATPQHPTSRGVADAFHLKDEFYYQLHFRENDPALKPILRVPALSSIPNNQVVAWALQRKDGGRSFGTTIGHYFDNWKDSNYRKLILNALSWAAGLAVPEGGVESTFLGEDEINRALLTQPIPTLLLTTAGAADISRQLNSELPRFDITVAHTPDALAANLSKYKLIVLHPCSWIQSDSSNEVKQSFFAYLKNGGGLSILYSAVDPEGKAGSGGNICKTLTWPNPMEIQNRKDIQHTTFNGTEYKYRRFNIQFVDLQHPVTSGLPNFSIIDPGAMDALDFHIANTDSIELLATVATSIPGGNEPLAFISPHPTARIFQVVLGRHDLPASGAPPLVHLIRNGSLWAAGY